jgi:HEPN domain-containing protein
MAQTLLQGKEPAHDGVCFHCQQSAEKYLKSILEENGSTIPKTHDLVDLLQMVTALGSDLPPLLRGCMFLSQFAVEFRYPGKDANERQATAALRWGDRVRTACRDLLGLV